MQECKDEKHHVPSIGSSIHVLGDFFVPQHLPKAPDNLPYVPAAALARFEGWLITRLGTRAVRRSRTRMPWSSKSASKNWIVSGMSMRNSLRTAATKIRRPPRGPRLQTGKALRAPRAVGFSPKRLFGGSK